MKASGPAQLSRHSQAAPAKMAQWFEEALGWQPLPSSTECDKLARRFQLLINGPTIVKNFVMLTRRVVAFHPSMGTLRTPALMIFSGSGSKAFIRPERSFYFDSLNWRNLRAIIIGKGHPRPSVLKTFGTYSCKSECWLAPIRKPRPSRLAVKRQKPGIK